MSNGTARTELENALACAQRSCGFSLILRRRGGVSPNFLDRAQAARQFLGACRGAE